MDYTLTWHMTCTLTNTDMTEVSRCNYYIVIIYTDMMEVSWCNYYVVIINTDVMEVSRCNYYIVIMDICHTKRIKLYVILMGHTCLSYSNKTTRVWCVVWQYHWGWGGGWSPDPQVICYTKRSTCKPFMTYIRDLHSWPTFMTKLSYYKG